MQTYICNACARKCNAKRNDDNGFGYCRMPLSPVLAKACLHFGEEPCISGSNGSGTVFFSGCTLKCVFCQNYDISHKGKGKTVSVERLADIFKELEEKGAHNINLVTPTHYAYAVMNALDIYRPSVPIVYNSSGFDSRKTLKDLKDYIDIYLMDFKFMSDDRAIKYADARAYADTAKSAIIQAAENIDKRCIFDENGMLKKGLIIRHLIMPQGTNDALNIIKWSNENVPFAVFSLMSQYLPCGDAAKYKELTRKITKREYEKVVSAFDDTDFEIVYTQSLSSSTNEYIPDFDLSGI